MKLIVCLGNPGLRYKFTRHNIGFRVGDALIKDLSLSKTGKKFKSVLYQGHINQESLYLLKPQTYMNLSGEAVQLCCSYYNIAMEDCVVIYDDVDLPFGKLRFRHQGKAGTHNGMKSIVSLLKTTAIPRLRFGVGMPTDSQDLADFVLSPFTKEEEIKLAEPTTRCVSFIRELLQTDSDRASKLLIA